MEAISRTQVKRRLSIDGGPDAAEVSKILRLSYKRRKLLEQPQGRRGWEGMASGSVLHSAPPDIVPILQPPMQPSQFFSDIKSIEADPRKQQQIRQIIQKFPPPIPPFLPHDFRSPEGGIMVPFIYPPPPVIQPDKLPYSIASFAKKNKRTSDSGDASPLSEKVYVEIPSLPFPPPNYMPYPLLSDKSSLTPGDVFEDLLDASEQLPRIDMVVASAAGSLFDIKTQAEEEGFSIEEFETDKSYRRALNRRASHRRRTEDENGSDESAESSGYEDDGDREFNEYLEYATQVETQDVHDKYQKVSAAESSDDTDTKAIPEDYINIAPTLSNTRGRGRKSKAGRRNRYDTSAADLDYKMIHYLPVSTYDVFTDYPKDIVFANGSNKERRREELKKNVATIESYYKENQRKVYESKRSQLLQKLKNLKESKLMLEESKIYDEDLQEHEETIGRKRDEELLRLRFIHNYELLKSSLNFYRSSNKVYKSMNSLVLNKLQKLKNFFEFQRDLFHGYLENENHDIFDVKTKESNHIFNGISERDYGSELKEIISNSMHAMDPENKLDRSTKTPPALGSLHDFMPLISSEEFNLITGDLPNKLKSSGHKDSSKYKHASNIKHKIFQNPLYNPATSGSDTNTSDSNSSNAPAKRRGRRGGTNSNPATDKLVEDVDKSKNSETLLLARIMKHFAGPQAANADELTADLEMMGVKTRWPPQILK